MLVRAFSWCLAVTALLRATASLTIDDWESSLSLRWIGLKHEDLLTKCSLVARLETEEWMSLANSLDMPSKVEANIHLAACLMHPKVVPSGAKVPPTKVEMLITEVLRNREVLIDPLIADTQNSIGDSAELIDSLFKGASALHYPKPYCLAARLELKEYLETILDTPGSAASYLGLQELVTCPKDVGKAGNGNRIAQAVLNLLHRTYGSADEYFDTVESLMSAAVKTRNISLPPILVPIFINFYVIEEWTEDDLAFIEKSISEHGDGTLMTTFLEAIPIYSYIARGSLDALKWTFAKLKQYHLPQPVIGPYKLDAMLLKPRKEDPKDIEDVLVFLLKELAIDRLFLDRIEIILEKGYLKVLKALVDRKAEIKTTRSLLMKFIIANRSVEGFRFLQEYFPEPMDDDLALFKLFILENLVDLAKELLRGRYTQQMMDVAVIWNAPELVIQAWEDSNHQLYPSDDTITEVIKSGRQPFMVELIHRMRPLTFKFAEIILRTMGPLDSLMIQAVRDTSDLVLLYLQWAEARSPSI